MFDTYCNVIIVFVLSNIPGPLCLFPKEGGDCGGFTVPTVTVGGGKGTNRKIITRKRIRRLFLFKKKQSDEFRASYIPTETWSCKQGCSRHHSPAYSLWGIYPRWALPLDVKVQKNPQMPKLSLDYLCLFTYIVRLSTKHKCRSQYHFPSLSYIRVTYQLHTIHN